MKSLLRKYLSENVQQADKLYFNTGKLPPEAREAVMRISNGDVWTRLVADLVYHMSKHSQNPLDSGSLQLAKNLHTYLINYNKNSLPLAFEPIQYSAGKDGPMHILDLYGCLNYRAQAVKQLQRLPSQVTRNLKGILNKPESNEYGFKHIGDKFRELAGFLEVLPKNENKRAEILNKIASSNHNIDQMIEVAKHFAYAFTGNEDEVPRDQVLGTVKQIDADIVQQTPTLLVIRVNDNEAMERLGCTTTWCFARPNSEGFWNDYAYLGYVYVIFDFSKDIDDATFLMTYLPGDGTTYASTNVPLEEIDIDNPYEYLQSIGVDMSVLDDEDMSHKRHDDEDEDEPKPKKKEKYVDPNQLSMAFESKKFIKGLLREHLK